MNQNDDISHLDFDPDISKFDAPSSVLTGYKTSKIKIINDEIFFIALTLGNAVKINADAECLIVDKIQRQYKKMLATDLTDFTSLLPENIAIKDHPIPFEPCSCGFYAYIDKESAISHIQNDTSCTLLEVAISGKYLEYDKGYRFAHQRVKKIIFGNCVVCQKESSHVIVSDEDIIKPTCQHHRKIGKTSYSYEEFTRKINLQNGDDVYLPIEVSHQNITYVNEYLDAELYKEDPNTPEYFYQTPSNIMSGDPRLRTIRPFALIFVATMSIVSFVGMWQFF